MSEGLEWSFVKYRDNQSCLDLLEGSPVGVFSLLNEVCWSFILIFCNLYFIDQNVFYIPHTQKQTKLHILKMGKQNTTKTLNNNNTNKKYTTVLKVKEIIHLMDLYLFYAEVMSFL